jgi:Ca-activated chloride channel family protein
MIAPEYTEFEDDVTPKDFVCVLDTSGSMSGRKIEQAKDALRFIFQNLNDEDRFRLIAFETNVDSYFDGWRDASGSNLRDVDDFIDGISAGGSTNIEGALAEACAVNPGRGRPMYIIFLTDGLPTTGNTNTTWLVDNMNAMNDELNARLFCFGVGDDVDYPFIDRLARENGGYTSSVSPFEDLEQPLSDFYAKIKSPVMTDLAVEINGTRIYDMLPAQLPDLFLGSQLVLTGRYNGEGNVNIALSGMLNGERVTFDWPVRLESRYDNDYIPRHWATRRVGYLMNEVRLYGENQELVDEITNLAQQHGIITPYTSMLVTEDMLVEEGWEVPMDNMMRHGLGGGGGAGGAPAPSAQQQSLGLQSMEYGEYYGQAELVQEFIQYQGGRTFYQNAELYWVDSEYDEGTQDVIEVEYLSDEYFDLIDEEPDVAEFLALGEQVIFIFEGQAYQINPQDE